MNICQKEGCKKKIKLSEQISNKCKCNFIFCKKHRLPVNHECKHNFKIEGIEKEKKIQQMKCVKELEKI